MKKNLVALAALAVVGAASAQSSVTLYGRMDLGAAFSKTTQGPATAKSTSLAGAQSARTIGRLGVRGSEDLGGGLKANFNIETNVNPDLAGTTFGTTRTAILQLQGGFGSATIGTYVNTFSEVRLYTATALGVAGGNFLDKVHGAASRGLGLRSENAIGYRSPSFGGLDLSIQTTHEKNEVAGMVNKTTGYIAGVGYNKGPVSALLALGQAKGQTPAVVGPPAVAATNGKVSDVAFAVSYNLGMAVPYVQFENSKGTGTLGATAEVKSRSWELGSKFPMGAFTPYITVSGGKIKTTPAAGLATSERKTRGVQIGTTYDLSKRTYVYAALGQDKNIAAALAGGVGDTKRTGYGLGLVHNF
ncbi:porin [Polaromonas sp. P1(28)-13]|nr:porin [Polaromonas sp. P1(28)-13]